MKNKQDILKLHPMIGRLTPMQWDEIHKAMDAYLNEYKAEQLTLTDVSQQREQFADLLIWYKYNVGRDNIKNCKELAEEYINL